MHDYMRVIHSVDRNVGRVIEYLRQHGLLDNTMIVYGVAFDFFNISGSLFVDNSTEPALRSSAQGLFMLMTNGRPCLHEPVL